MGINLRKAVVIFDEVRGRYVTFSLSLLSYISGSSSRRAVAT